MALIALEVLTEFLWSLNVRDADLKRWIILAATAISVLWLVVELL